jgi:hypothetical protein
MWVVLELESRTGHGSCATPARRERVNLRGARTERVNRRVPQRPHTTVVESANHVITFSYI